MDGSPLAHVVAVLTDALDCPTGNTEHRLELLVSLRPGARLDEDGASGRRYCVRRVVKGVTVWSGFLAADTETWALHSDDEDDPLWLMDAPGPLRPGTHLTLRSPEGAVFTFRIINVGHPQGLGWP
jgi:hypothetical protein